MSQELRDFKQKPPYPPATHHGGPGGPASLNGCTSNSDPTSLTYLSYCMLLRSSSLTDESRDYKISLYSSTPVKYIPIIWYVHLVSKSFYCSSPSSTPLSLLPPSPSSIPAYARKKATMGKKQDHSNKHKMTSTVPY